MNYIKSGDAEKSAHYIVKYSNKFNAVTRLLIAKIVFDDKFLNWSGSGKPHQHHYGSGGLVVHTAEVIKLCMTINKTTHSKVDEQLLFLSALYHDVGKIWDYKQTDKQLDEWCGTDHKEKIYHISRSNMIWYEHAKEVKLKTEDIDSVSHAILAHHCLPEWRSPVKPSTPMAWILHLCDNMSARLCDNGATK